MKNNYNHFFFYVLVILFNSNLLSQTSVNVSPANLIVNSASMVSIQILVNNVSNLHSASITMGFDSSVLRYSSISDGAFLQSNSMGYSVVMFKTLYPNSVSPNQVKVDQAILGNASVTGSGLLFTINFTTNHSGQTQISIADFVLLDLNSNVISANSISGSVTVSTNLSPKVFLEGPFNGITMNTTLNSLSYLPLNQPYSKAPWNYSGNESVAAGFFSLHTNIVDWILLELRSGTSAGSIVSKRAAFLLSNGNIVDLDGYSPVSFTGPTAGYYYIVIKHRNHLAVMSSGSLALDIATISYDFTTSQNQAYNSSYLPMKSLGGDKFGLYSGDANADGSVDAIDNNAYWRPNKGKPFDYNQGADFNMDGSIDSLDIDNCWRPNNGRGTQVP